MMESINAHIDQIGNQLVRCALKCPGVSNDHMAGVLPRCLFLEERDHSIPGAIVVGINPGHNTDFETGYYRERSSSYESVKTFFQEHGSGHPYYKRIRNLLSLTGYGGTILWTELIKCQNETRGQLPPLQTFRTCSSTFLAKEISVLPQNWLIVGIGKDAYNALAYLHPTRSLLGISHPTGSRTFHSIFEKGSNGAQVRPDLAQALAVFKTKPGSSLWLGK